MPVDPNSGPWPEEFVDGHLSNIENKTKNFNSGTSGTILIPAAVRTILPNKLDVSTKGLVKVHLMETTIIHNTTSSKILHRSQANKLRQNIQY